MIIWKFQIGELADVVEIDMPKGAQILTIQMQHGNPCIWAVVDPLEKSVRRGIAIHGTGHNINTAKKYIAEGYIGTFQLDNGSLIFHAFDMGEI